MVWGGINIRKVTYLYHFCSFLKLFHNFAALCIYLLLSLLIHVLNIKIIRKNEHQQLYVN